TAVGELVGGQKVRFPIAVRGLLGPDSAPPSGRQQSQPDRFAFRDATRDVLDYLRTEHRVPARVFIGADAAAPADFLMALARAYAAHHKGSEVVGELGKDVQVLAARHVAQDTPNLFGGWVIHREGFRAPQILEVARLQAWTLKPAIR